MYSRLTLPVHLGFSPSFGGVRVVQSLVFIVMFCRSLFVQLSLFLLAIALFVLLRFTAFDYPFGIFKIFRMMLASV
jgi:hypothetical protein